MTIRDRSGFDVVRYAPAGAVRAAEGEETDGPEGVLFGHFSAFNRFYEIDSPWEGNFLERIAPGTFAETFEQDVQRCWFEHGYSAILDRLSLGAIERLEEDKTGAYYEVRLFDGLPVAFVEGLRAGEYGASFRMRITGETIDSEPGVSEHNPKGLPEVTITSVRCPEFGPVSIGASPFATANLRCATDDYYEALRGRDLEAWARARTAAGLEQDLTVEADAEGAAGGDSSNTPQPEPARARASISRLIDAGISPYRSQSQ